MVSKKIVCLGGGVGTANLLSGIKDYFADINAVVSMADDGGSAGRLRRYYKIPPTGDIVNCMIALSNADKVMLDLLKFRFPGERYGPDNILPGQKIANLMFAALILNNKNLNEAIAKMREVFKVSANIYPSTLSSVSLRAKTSTGHIVRREENIDLGNFKGKIKQLYIHPKNPRVDGRVLDAIKNADVIVAGPGDLYTTILPVLIVPAITQEIKKSKAKKIFVVNVANKFFETPNYSVSDFISAIRRHCGFQPFDTFLINNNTAFSIPEEFKNQYSIAPLRSDKENNVNCVYEDLINEDFPIYHSPKKLAKSVVENI
ncbi:MAG: YvcK family protein [Patescibacteria group bacterium]|nr:YvcK family protein [Patescibacteria group bacterium]